MGLMKDKDRSIKVQLNQFLVQKLKWANLKFKDMTDQETYIINIKSNETSSIKPLFFDHLGRHRQYWRDIMLGVDDGLVSTFLLVAGVSGGKLSVNSVLLISISGSIAGALSMSFGEYVATKSQDEVLNGEISLENMHIRDHKQDELRELDTLLDKIGIPSDSSCLLRQEVKEFYHDSDEALLKIMTALEFGVLDEERRNPFGAAAFSGLLFIIGSLPSVLPFCVAKNTFTGLIVAEICTGKVDSFCTTKSLTHTISN